MVAGQCCRVRGRERPSLRHRRLFSLPSLTRTRESRECGTRASRGRACSTSDKSSSAGGGGGGGRRPEPPDDASRDPGSNTAAAKRRHCDQVCATYSVLYDRVEESLFRLGSWKNYRAGNLTRESSRHIVKPCLLHLVANDIYRILFILLYKK